VELEVLEFVRVEAFVEFVVLEFVKFEEFAELTVLEFSEFTASAELSPIVSNNVISKLSSFCIQICSLLRTSPSIAN
jgi:hypothetical protein